MVRDSCRVGRQPLLPKVTNPIQLPLQDSAWVVRVVFPSQWEVRFCPGRACFGAVTPPCTFLKSQVKTSKRCRKFFCFRRFRLISSDTHRKNSTTMNFHCGFLILLPSRYAPTPSLTQQGSVLAPLFDGLFEPVCQTSLLFGSQKKLWQKTGEPFLGWLALCPFS